jgi:hypothetical protein
MPDRVVLPVAPGQREVLRQALEDAVYYRDPPVQCGDCDAVDALCEGCAYLDLGRELGLEAPG